MSDIIRYYLEGETPHQNELRAYFLNHYPDQVVQVQFEQQLTLDGKSLSTFLVTLPLCAETQYIRSMFLSALPINLPFVVDWHYATGPRTPHHEQEIRQWLRRSQEWRVLMRGGMHQHARHNGPDVPLMSGNLREE